VSEPVDDNADLNAHSKAGEVLKANHGLVEGAAAIRTVPFRVLETPYSGTGPLIV
jgi:hypothetical protein